MLLSGGGGILYITLPFNVNTSLNLPKYYSPHHRLLQQLQSTVVVDVRLRNFRCVALRKDSNNKNFVSISLYFSERGLRGRAGEAVCGV